MFGNNSVPKGGFNAFKAPAKQPAGQAQSQQQPSTGTPYGAYSQQPPTFGSGFLQDGHYPGRPLGFGARPPGFGKPPAPAGNTMSPYAAAQGPAYISTAGNPQPSYNNYGQGFGPGVPILKGPGPLTSSPVTPGWSLGSAQLIAPPQPSTGYYPGFDPRTQDPYGQPWQPTSGFPPQTPEQPVFGGPANRRPPARPGPADDFEQVGDFGTAVMTDYYNPETGQRYQTSAGNIAPKPGTGWVRGTGPAQGPGRAQPIEPPPQGSPYRLGGDGFYPVPESGPAMPPTPPQGPPAPVRMPYGGGMDYEQGPPVVRPGLTLRPPAQTQYSKKLGRHLTAEEQADVDEGWRSTEAERAPDEQARRKELFADGGYFKPPPIAPGPKPPPSESQRLADQEYYRLESERRRADYDVARISNDRAATARYAANNSPAYRGGRRLK